MKTKNNLLSIIALISIVAIVGMVMIFLATRGSSTTKSKFDASTKFTESANAAGMAAGQYCETNWCGPCSKGNMWVYDGTGYSIWYGACDY